MPNEKSDFINLLRGLAIFLMLWGHCIQYCCGGQFDFFENDLFKAIYSFHMPLFMTISGYLFFFSASKRELAELVPYKVKSLLYPILMGSIVNLIITIGIASLVCRKLGGVNINLQSLWFLWSVLAASFVMSFVAKTKLVLIKILLVASGLIFVTVLPCKVMNIYMYPYFVIGYLVARKIHTVPIKLINAIGFILSVCFIVMLIYYKKDYFIYTTGIFGGKSLSESLLIDCYRWCVGFFGCASIAWISKLLYKWSAKFSFHKLLVILGENSLALYVLSVSLLSYYLPKIMGLLLKRLTWINWNDYISIYYVITFIVAVCYSLLILWIVKLLKKTNAHALIFGR